MSYEEDNKLYDSYGSPIKQIAVDEELEIGLIVDKEENIRNMLIDHHFKFDYLDEKRDRYVIFNRNGYYDIFKTKSGSYSEARGTWFVRECNGKVLLVKQWSTPEESHVYQAFSLDSNGKTFTLVHEYRKHKV